MSVCKVVSCVIAKGYLLWVGQSFGRIQLTFALVHFVLQGQTCLLLQVYLDFLLLHKQSRDITLPTKATGKAIVFPVVTYGCEKAECQRIDAFKLWVLEKTPQSTLDSKKIKPVNLREINPEYSLEGLMLKLKLQYFGHLMWTDNSLQKSLMLGKIEGRRRGCQTMRWLDGITEAWTWTCANPGRRWGTGRPGNFLLVTGRNYYCLPVKLRKPRHKET